MKVFIANIDLISKSPDVYLALLPQSQKIRANKFQKDTRKMQFILGHLMANSIGEQYTSIAHKDKLVVVATNSDVPVGIDIENTSKPRDFVAASALIGTKRPKTLGEFYKLFTKSEAVYKLGTNTKHTVFIQKDDYLICVVSTKKFDTPALQPFDINLFFAPKKHQ